MELIRTYPLIFILTVIVPLAGGVVGAYLGWDALKGRAQTEAHQSFVEKNLKELSSALPLLAENTKTIRMYQQAQDAATEKDQFLLTVLAHYERMKQAVAKFEQFKADGHSSAADGLAETILNEIRSTLPPIRVDPTLPNNPLIILAGPNIYRVLFAVPMRIPPHLEFQKLPPRVSVTITDKSRFGFTVIFSPASAPVDRFTFTADAEL